MKHHPYNLRGSSLEVFSALYSLTKKRAFLGSYEDLAGWLEIDLKTLKRAISKLQEKGIVYVEQKSYARYEFQAFHIKGYPLPDYKYCGKRSTTKAPVIDTQNIEEYREEIAAFERQQKVTQNEQVVTQNEQVSKEKNQKKNNYNIYNKTSFLTKEVVVGDKPTAAAPQKLKEEDILPPPTSLQEVIDYAQEKQPGISMEVVRDFFVYYSAKGWRYKNNGRVHNWKAELFLFDQRGKRWAKEREAKSFVRAQMGVPQEVLDMEERMRENRRREREQQEIEANTPEAKAAAERVLSKFCKK